MSNLFLSRLFHCCQLKLCRERETEAIHHFVSPEPKASLSSYLVCCHEDDNVVQKKDGVDTHGWKYFRDLKEQQLWQRGLLKGQRQSVDLTFGSSRGHRWAWPLTHDGYSAAVIHSWLDHLTKTQTQVVTYFSETFLWQPKHPVHP